MSNDTQDSSLTDLRRHLFETLRGVRSGSINIETARAINELGKTLVDTAKVEVDYLRASGGGESTFIDTAVGAGNVPPQLPYGGRPAASNEEPPTNGIVGMRRHVLGR